MNVLICCDKFKSSLSAIDVCQSIAKGLQHSNEDVNIDIHPMADGGDGTISVLEEHLDLNITSVSTIDPLGREITAHYATDKKTAYIELAAASGIALLKPNEYNLMVTTTIGTGLLVHHALQQGLNHIVLGLGGSCTTDAGLGIAYVLGYNFLNSEGDQIIPNGETLNRIKEISYPDASVQASFDILCDVDNLLYGPGGAAYIFGPQKGASEQDVAILDTGLQNVAKVINRISGKEIDTLQGGGAAGGIAAGLYGLLDAQIHSGFTYLKHVSHLEGKMAWADLVITGEGQLDEQSFGGKVVGQILSLSETHKLPVVAIVGRNVVPVKDVPGTQLIKIISVSDHAKNLEDSMKEAAQYLFKIGSEIDLTRLKIKC